MAGLGWWRTVPGGAAWLDALPRLVAECAQQWELEVEAPYPTSVGWVAPVRRAEGGAAVLKLNFPEPESEHEADALRFWGGDGAVRLLAHDPERHALLLERLEPGEQLWTVEDDEKACGVAAGVLERLWRPAPQDGPFRPLAGEAGRWAEELPRRWERHGRPVRQPLLDEAIALCGELAATQPELVVCHQDLHGGNVLSSGGGWKAIDPKPVVGERAFDLASLLRDRRPVGSAGVVRRRLDLLTEALGVDRERARGWGIVHALAWGLEDDRVHEEIVRCAELLAARG